MTSQSVLIGVIIGVFFVGLVVGYGVFSATANNSMNNSQMIMNDPQLREQMMGQFLEHSDTQNQLMESMVQDPALMRSFMQDSKHADEMISIMKENHDFAMGMMYTMMEDPGLRLQLLGHMTENSEVMKQMKIMIESMNKQGMGNQGMMSSETNHQEMMMKLMQDPESREKMIQLMSKHADEMQQLLSSELIDAEFDKTMVELMEKHMEEMQDVMSENSMHHSMK